MCVYVDVVVWVMYDVNIIDLCVYMLNLCVLVCCANSLDAQQCDADAICRHISAVRLSSAAVTSALYSDCTVITYTILHVTSTVTMIHYSSINRHNITLSLSYYIADLYSSLVIFGSMSEDPSTAVIGGSRRADGTVRKVTTQQIILTSGTQGEAWLHPP